MSLLDASVSLETALPPLQKPVGAVVAAIDILRWLGGSAEPQRLSDITRALSLNSSTALNILRTLEFERLVAFDRKSKRYSLAEGLADLAAPLTEGRDGQRRLSRAMHATAHELGATVLLWRRVGEEVELVAVAESTDTMRIAFTLGRRLPLFLGAMGRLIAGRSDLPADEMRRLFSQVRWALPLPYETWCEEVADTRRTGAGVDRGHVNLGILGVAVPVEPEGPIQRVVSATLFQSAHGEDDLARIIDRLKQIAVLV